MDSSIKTFYIIGAGSSFLDVTEEEWKFLEDKNTITFARIPYGDRKTKYYLSIEKEHADRSVLKYMAKRGWFDTKLFLYNLGACKYARSLGFKSIKPIFKKNFYFMPSRLPWFVENDEPPNTFDETIAKNFRQPLFRYRGQLTAVINACLILGAEEIRLIGVDLDNFYNFYVQDDYKYLDELCKDEETINEFKKYMDTKFAVERRESKTDYNPDFNPDTMHPTSMRQVEGRWDEEQRGIDDIIEWIDQEMKKKGMSGIYTTNKDSILYGKIGYKSINETS